MRILAIWNHCVRLRRLLRSVGCRLGCRAHFVLYVNTGHTYLLVVSLFYWPAEFAMISHKKVVCHKCITDCNSYFGILAFEKLTYFSSLAIICWTYSRLKNKNLRIFFEQFLYYMFSVELTVNFKA